jgi:hypothetical protein
MTAILPTTWTVRGSTLDVGGKYQRVAWLECGGLFDVRRLACLLRGHLAALEHDDGGPLLPSELDAQVAECLTRLSIFHPTSPLSLACTLLDLPTLPTPHSLAYLIISSLSTFPPSSFTSTTPPSPPPIRHLLSSLSHIRTSLSPITYISTTSTTYFPPSTSSLLPLPRPSLPPPFPTHSTIVNPKPTLQDPLLVPRLPTSGGSTIGIDWHISLYPAPRTPVLGSQGTMREALEKEKERREECVGEEGFLGRVRKGGAGRDLGEWNFEVGKRTIWG